MTVVIGTAGHIDHGKTTLLRALTGIDADRLPEEQRRGMTIDVGYAYLDLPDGSSIDFVDVPGHDALVGNMLVGAGEIDAALVVVAADDGPRAQTLEHLELLDALGIRQGLAVVTKTDTVDAGRVAAVSDALAELLGRTSLAGAPVMAVSALTGDGLDSLRAGIHALRDRVAARVPPGATAVRLPIDRAFSVRGRGIVVTGTLRGSVGRGDALRIEPDGLGARARGVQVHGVPVERSDGGRTALDLGGVDPASVHRGQVVVAVGDRVVARSDRLLVALRPPVTWAAGRVERIALRDGETLRLHAGTEAVDARVLRVGRAPERDGDATAEVVRVLRLERPVAVAPGDRFVLRRPSPAATASVGRVLDTTPPRGPARRRATPERIAATVRAAGHDALRSASLELHGVLAEAAAHELAADVRDALSAAALAAVRDHHAADAGSAGLPLSVLRSAVGRAARRLVALDERAAASIAASIVERLEVEGRLVRDGDRVRDPATAPAVPASLSAAMDRLEAILAVPAPPPLSEAARAAVCPPEGIAALARSGRIVRLEEDLAWAASEHGRLARLALEMAAQEPLTPAALRDATGTSRRFVLAILEDLDRRGILRRTPEGHVPGPRASP